MNSTGQKNKLPEYLKILSVLLLSAIVLVLSSLIAFNIVGPFQQNFAQERSTVKSTGDFGEGSVSKTTITVGPFDLKHRYRSTEGPFAQTKTTIEKLITSKDLVVSPESVKFVEKNKGNPAMESTLAAQEASPDNKVIGNPGQLYWLKGCKLEVLDENGIVQPTGEFIGHLVIDVDSSLRNKLFPEGDRCNFNRILTITQGQTEMIFPDGFGVPAAGNETWHFRFQAANRTTDVRRKVKHRLTLYFIKDQDLIRPITALSWVVPHIEVVVDKLSPEMQWLIPPGKSNWTSIFRDPHFGRYPRTIHAVWSYVHPFCTSISLMAISPAQQNTIFTAKCQTKTKPGLEIEHIDYISSGQGIVVPSTGTYEVDVAYNNTSVQTADAMAALGIFMEDNDFVRPDWAY